MSCSSVCNLLSLSGMCALWTAIFYYCINTWPTTQDSHAQVITFMTYASGFFMVGACTMLAATLTAMVSCLGCFSCCFGFLSCLTYMAIFWFNLVWSIMGANWLQDKGLGHDTWFKAAAITTCVFSFLSSWGVIVGIFLGLTICCCVVCVAVKQMESLEKELKNMENQGDNTASEKKLEANKEKIEKLKKYLSAIISKLPVFASQIQSMADKHTDNLTTKNLAHTQDEEAKPLNDEANAETVEHQNDSAKEVAKK